MAYAAGESTINSQKFFASFFQKRSAYLPAPAVGSNSKDLTAALNLDGGPVACQGVALGPYRHQVIGKWEFQANQTGGHLLSWLYGDQFAMPVVLAVFSK